MKESSFYPKFLFVLFATVVERGDVVSSFASGPSSSAAAIATVSTRGNSQLWAAKGFGSSGGGKGAAGAGFGSKSKSSSVEAKQPSKQQLQKQLERTYGGTSTQQIALATQKRVEQSIKALPPHLQMATQLYQQLQKWNTHVSRMTVLQQANLPQADIDGATRVQEEFERLCEEHGFTEIDLHNIFQKITWDASADAKAARSILGSMSAEIEERVIRACEMVAEPVLNAKNKGGRCLDVGCGVGSIIPQLTKAGISRNQLVGIDLSTEMIRNAQQLYPDVSFGVVDFLNEYMDDADFDGIIFCSALHDMPDPFLALKKASSLLRPQGRLVIVHPQGASHVLKQASANPILVKRGLPLADELESFDESLGLLIQPAAPGSAAEEKEGYLAVLEKR